MYKQFKNNEPIMLRLIHDAARKEFLTHGFKSASLRKIVKAVGATTGAFYRYYSSKEELFEALVSEHYFTAVRCFRQAQKDFSALELSQQYDNIGRIEEQFMMEMLTYAREHLTEFRLILRGADGTQYADLIGELTELELENMRMYREALKRMKHEAPEIEVKLERVLARGLFSSFFEIVLDDVSLSEAQRYVRALHIFYEEGWIGFMQR